MQVPIIKLKNFNSDMDSFYIELLKNESYENKTHSHDCFQIVICRQANISHTVCNKTARMLKGDVTIIPPGMPHKIDTGSPECIYYNIAFSQDLFALQLPYNHTIRTLLDNLKNSESIALKFTPKYEDIYLFESVVGKMRIEFSCSRPGRNEIIINCLHAVLAVIASMYIQYENDFITEQESKIRRMNQCIFYAESHFDEPIPLEKIVKMSAMSRATFCSMFKEMTGMPFAEYLNKKRVERIQTLIREGYDITRAALDNGFNEFSTFYRNFVKYTGMSPSRFKKICEQEKNMQP